jgi:hypothetical protein
VAPLPIYPMLDCFQALGIKRYTLSALSGQFAERSYPMSIASDLLERHIQTLVADHEQWQSLIADDMVWELRMRPPSVTPRDSQAGTRSFGM